MEYGRLILAVLALTSSALLYLIYRLAIPKPIPGIPHNKSAVNSLLGDIPSMLKYVASTKEVVQWFAEQCVELDSPIVQLFIRPFGRPMVFISDWREAQDILIRRKEFDRSQFFVDVFRGLLPKAFISMPTDDTFRHQRRLFAYTHAHEYLYQVAVPRVYSATLELIELWHLKINLAGGHAFSAFSDIHHMTLDSSWESTFGVSSYATKSQIHLLSSLAKLEELPQDQNTPAKFPQATTPVAFNAIIAMSDSLHDALGSPAPAWHHWFVRWRSSYRNAKKYKDDLFDRHFRDARKRYSGNAGGEKVARTAVEGVIQREAIAAKEEGKALQLDSSMVRDELFAFLIAGHETSSTTIGWGIKYLSDSPQVQQRLRDVLREQYPDEAAAKTNPSATKIVKREIPYLDAVLEEILRCSNTANGAIRNAKVDMDLLGYRIPAGTDVYLLSNGPGFMSPAFEVDESRRSPTSRENKDKSGGQWNSAGIGAFNPDRWLTYDEKGGEFFNPRAGPQLAFGGGPRGCYGKRAAYINLRILIVLVVWNFELKRTPTALGGSAAMDKLTHRPQQCFVQLGLAQG